MGEKLYTQEELDAAVAGARWQAAHDILTENAMKTPTQEQLKDPQWWDENIHPWAEVIYIEEDARGGFEGIHQRQSAHGSVVGVKHPDNDLICYTRPKPQPTDAKSQEWVDGLPPVGCECEYQPDPAHKNIWHRCTFLAHMDGEFFVLVSEDSSVDRMNDSPPASSRFRPLKTASERERDEFASDLLKDLEALDIYAPGDTAMAIAIGFMNRGWRKTDAGMLRKGGE